MIRFDNWLIQADGDIIARQFDHLTRSLTVIGDIPDGWDWVVLVRASGNMDIIPLSPVEGGLGVVLTASQLSIGGYYEMQLRGTQGDLVRHTNVITAKIPASLSGDKQWPTIPSEFSDMERRINDGVERAENAAAKAEGYTTNPPTVGENGNWWEWNGEEYTDTGKPSRGEQGAVGKAGATIQTAEFDNNNGRYVVTLTDGTAVSMAGYDPANSTIWSFMREDFERFSAGDNNFIEQAEDDWKNHDFRPVANTRYSVVENDGNKCLSMQCMTSDAIASLVLDHPIQGEHIIEFDYMSTHPGGVGLPTDYMDLRLYTVGELAICARVNYKGVSRIYTKLAGEKQQSPIITDATGDWLTYEPGVWYRIKVCVRVGEITMKVWKRDTESEPVGKSGPGVESLALDLLTLEFIATPYEPMFYLWEFGEEPPTADSWQAYLDNVKVYHDITEDIVTKTLAALPVYNGEVVEV